MRCVVHVVAMGLVSGVICSSTQAQGMLLPDTGSRVRALPLGSSSWTIGTLVGTSGDTLLIRTRPSRCCGVDTLSLHSISELDVSRHHGSNTEDVLLGVGLGTAAGVVVAVGVTEIGCAGHDAGGMCALAFPPYAFLFGTAGLLAGAYLGSKVQTDDWDRIYPPRRAAIIVAPTGDHSVGIGLAFTFGGSA